MDKFSALLLVIFIIFVLMKIPDGKTESIEKDFTSKITQSAGEAEESIKGLLDQLGVGK